MKNVARTHSALSVSWEHFSQSFGGERAHRQTCSTTSLLLSGKRFREMLAADAGPATCRRARTRLVPARHRARRNLSHAATVRDTASAMSDNRPYQRRMCVAHPGLPPRIAPSVQAGIRTELSTGALRESRHGRRARRRCRSCRRGAAVELRDADGVIRPEFVEHVAAAIDAANAHRLRELVGDLHEADSGDLIEALDAGSPCSSRQADGR